MQFLRYGALVLAIMVSTSSQADDFPTKPIKLIVPFAAGGVVDVSGRLVAEKMAAELGQPVVVENLPGGYGMIAADTVAKSQADGYTLLIDAPAVVMNPALRHAPYDPIAELEPVGQIMQMPFALGVNPQLALNSYEEFVAYAKANPGRLNMAASGAATQLAGALFGLKAGIEFQTLPYQGAAPATTAVVNGEADFIVLDLANLSQFISVCSVKGLAISGLTRAKNMPGLPTLSELGVRDMEIVTWVGIFRPKNVPADVAEKLENAFAKAVHTEAVHEYIESRSAHPSDLDQPAFAETFRSEVGMWARIVKDAHIRVE